MKITEWVEEVGVYCIAFIMGFLIAGVIICKIFIHLVNPMSNILSELDAKGIRVRTMMIKAQTDCACAKDAPKLDLEQEESGAHPYKSKVIQ